jgi:hypothetical protein
MTGSLLRALVTRNCWLLARGQLAPLVSLRWLVSAGSALVALGPFLSALVMRTGWFWLVQHFRAGLAPPAGLRWFRAGRSRPFLERACHVDRLVLGSSGSSRHWSHSVLVSADSARAAPLASLRRSRALVSAAHFLSDARSPARANSTGIRLLSSVPHLWSSSFDCPASQVKKTKVRPDYSSAPTQLALCLRLALLI